MSVFLLVSRAFILFIHCLLYFVFLCLCVMYIQSSRLNLNGISNMKTTCNFIAFPSAPQPHGGPGSFQTRFEQALSRHGWTITYSDESLLLKRPDVVWLLQELVGLDGCSYRSFVVFPLSNALMACYGKISSRIRVYGVVILSHLFFNHW